MPITKQISSLSNAKQLTGADSPQNPGSLVTYTYGPAQSTAGQTVINLGFSVATTNTANFFLWVNGILLSFGSSNDYTFTSIQSNGTSAQITLANALPANANINASYLGVLIPNASATSILTLNAATAANTVYTSTKFRNLAINGNFDFWQRVENTTTTVNTASTVTSYTADMFINAASGSTVKNYSVAQSSTVPTAIQSGFVSTYSYLFTMITGISSFAASDVVEACQYRMEGYDFERIFNRNVTLGFWINASIAGTYSLALRNGNFNRSYLTTFSVTSANTWQFITVTVPMDAAANQSSWIFNNGVGLVIDIGTYSGSTYQTSTLNAWQTGNFTAASTATNWMGTSGATMRIAQFSIVEGSYGFGSTDFIRCGNSIPNELALCQRYYEKSFDQGQTLGTATYSNAITMRLVNGVGNGSTLGTATSFKVTKRTTPTTTIYNPQTGASGSLYDADNSTTYAVATTGSGTSGFGLTNNSGGTLGASPNFVAWQWASDAGL